MDWSQHQGGEEVNDDEREMIPFILNVFDKFKIKSMRIKKIRIFFDEILGFFVLVKFGEYVVLWEKVVNSVFRVLILSIFLPFVYEMA